MNQFKKPLISVVILNFNGLKYIRKTIPAILSQKYNNYEVIFVDNGSTDGSLLFIKQFKQIKCIENKYNLGYSKGKNIGIEYAGGDYLLLIDEDILIEDKNTLKILLNESHLLPNAAFLGPLIVDLGNDLSKYYGNYLKIKDLFYKKSYSVDNLIKANLSFEIACPHGGAIFIKKDILKKIGKIDDSQPYMIDDYDLGIRSCLLGYKNYLTTKTHVLHLGVSDRLTGKIYNWKYKYYFSGNMRIIFKNFKIINLIIASTFFVVFSFFKTLKQFIIRKDIKILLNYLKSIFIFIKNFKSTYNERCLIQKKRLIKRDIFFDIKHPKFLL